MLSLLSLYIFIGMSLTAQVRLTVNPVRSDLKPYLELRTSGHPAFPRALAHLVPGGSTGALDAILPFSVIVHNVSSQPLLMTGIVFEVEDSSGHVNRYAQYSAYFGNIPEGRFLPKQDRFVSPSHTVNQSVAAKRLDLLESGDAPGASLADKLRQSKRVVVSGDSIIMDDGTFVGPDTCGAFDRIQQEQLAEKGVYAEILSLQSAPAEVLKARLAGIADRAFKPSPNPFEQDFFNRKRQQLGRMLLNLANHRDVDAVFRTAVVESHNVVVHR